MRWSTWSSCRSNYSTIQNDASTGRRNDVHVGREDSASAIPRPANRSVPALDLPSPRAATTRVLALAAAVLHAHGLREEADSFADQLVPRLGDKVEVARFFLRLVPRRARDRVALEILHSATGTTQRPCPRVAAALRQAGSVPRNCERPEL